jgi:hypothetical protein
MLRHHLAGRFSFLKSKKAATAAPTTSWSRPPMRANWQSSFRARAMRRWRPAISRHGKKPEELARLLLDFLRRDARDATTDPAA